MIRIEVIYFFIVAEWRKESSEELSTDNSLDNGWLSE